MKNKLKNWLNQKSVKWDLLKLRPSPSHNSCGIYNNSSHQCNCCVPIHYMHIHVLKVILTLTYSLLSSIFINISPQWLITLFSLFVCLFSLSLPCTAQCVCLCFTLKNILTYLLMYVASLEHSNTCTVL